MLVQGSAWGSPEVITQKHIWTDNSEQPFGHHRAGCKCPQPAEAQGKRRWRKKWSSTVPRASPWWLALPCQQGPRDLHAWRRQHGSFPGLSLSHHCSALTFGKRMSSLLLWSDCGYAQHTVSQGCEAGSVQVRSCGYIVRLCPLRPFLCNAC